MEKISAKQPCSVTIWKKEDGKIVLAAADMSQKQDEIRIVLDGLYEQEKSKRMEALTGRWRIKQDPGQAQTILCADTRGLAGVSLELVLQPQQ